MLQICDYTITEAPKFQNSLPVL